MSATEVGSVFNLPEQRETQADSPSYLAIIACVACLSKSISFPAIADCALREVPVFFNRAGIRFAGMVVEQIRDFVVESFTRADCDKVPLWSFGRSTSLGPKVEKH